MYCFIQEVPAPIEMYDALHASVKARMKGREFGLLLHLARESAGGFSIIEIWTSKQECDRATEEVLLPAMRDFFDGETPFAPPPEVAFEPRGLVIPSAGVLT